MLSFFIFLFIFIFNDTLLKEYLVQGRYFLNHALHNLLISALTIKNVYNSITKLNSNAEQELHPLVLPLVYSIHVYHIILYYERINNSEKLHHFLCLFVAVPIVYFNFSNRDLLGFSFFATTGISSIVHYFSLFLYKNNIIKKITTCRINYTSNIYCRCPLVITNCSFLGQYILINSKNFTPTECFCSILVLLILLWNGVYFQKIVIEHYFKYYFEEIRQDNYHNHQS